MGRRRKRKAKGGELKVKAEEGEIIEVKENGRCGGKKIGEERGRCGVEGKPNKYRRRKMMRKGRSERKIRVEDG